MSLTKDQVRHVAKLARIAVSDQEVEKFTTQLADILKYMDILNEVDTNGVKLTSQVTDLKNVAREDAVSKWIDRDELLACTHLPVEQNQIRVKPAISK